MDRDKFYEYDDDDLVMRLPEYLRAKRGKRFFKPHGRRHTDRQIFALSVDLTADKEFAAKIRDTMSDAKPSDWEGVQTRIIRLGPTANIEGGFEILVTRTNTINGDIVHSYEVIFPVGGTYIRLVVGGRGEVTSFDAACQEIASSIRLKNSAHDRTMNENPPDTSALRPASIEPSNRGEQEPKHASTYLSAKARIRDKYVHSALILPDDRGGGVNLFLLLKRGGALLPAGSSWHETEEAAKAHGLESLKIRHSDWVVHEGEPDWASALKDAKEAAIEAYKDARAPERPEE